MSAYDDHEHYNNTDAAIRAGMALSEPKTLVDGHAVAFVVPAGAKVEKVDIESYLPRPLRKRGHFQFSDAKSFGEFVNREKTPETVIFASREGTKFEAGFNGNEAERTGDSTGDHGGGEAPNVVESRPGWGDYKASYACPFSPEWKIWSGANKQKMTQFEFATFIEDNFLDIVQPAPTFDPFYTNWPDGNAMIAVSRGLSAKTDVTFGSAVRLDNGQVQFKYEETINGSVIGGLIDIPQKFAVGIPVFAGTMPWQIVAKLRYRVERGGLTMWFDFERLFKVTERAFDEARDEIAKATSVPIYLGSRS